MEHGNWNTTRAWFLYNVHILFHFFSLISKLGLAKPLSEKRWLQLPKPLRWGVCQLSCRDLRRRGL